MIDPSGLFGVAMASAFNMGMQALSVVGIVTTVHKVVTQGVDALTFWDIISLLPFGYIGAGRIYASGIQGVRNLAHSFPAFTNILKRYGDDLAQIATRYRGVVTANFGTGVHQFFKNSAIGKFIGKLENITANSNWIRVTLDKQIARSGIGSRPDITIQFPNFRFAIVLDIKPVPPEIFANGWLYSVGHLYESSSVSIKRQREGTIGIFNQKGYITLYLYLPYPGLY
jgi:hypothetical protein